MFRSNGIYSIVFIHNHEQFTDGPDCPKREGVCVHGDNSQGFITCVCSVGILHELMNLCS